MQGAQVSGVPVPEVCAEGNWRGHFALLLSWLPGWPIAEELRRRPSQAWQMGALFGQAQASIHQVGAPTPLDERPDAWIDWLGPEESALAERLRASGYAGGILLHLDYHPLNALTDGETITGIIDWGNACAGDPRADAARTVAILRLDYSGRLSPQERAVRRQFERGWRVGYERQAGPLRDMAPFYAWAGAMMQRDLATKRAHDDLARIRRWTERWKACLR
jgi:Ser/Thr protein kinase RdoA (MazF antagonist)